MMDKNQTQLPRLVVLRIHGLQSVIELSGLHCNSITLHRGYFNHSFLSLNLRNKVSSPDGLPTSWENRTHAKETPYISYYLTHQFISSVAFVLPFILFQWMRCSSCCLRLILHCALGLILFFLLINSMSLISLLILIISHLTNKHVHKTNNQNTPRHKAHFLLPDMVRK